MATPLHQQTQPTIAALNCLLGELKSGTRSVYSVSGMNGAGGNDPGVVPTINSRGLTLVEADVGTEIEVAVKQLEEMRVAF